MKHKAQANRLAKLSGASFDRAYMAAMVKGHKEAIALFEKQTSMGRDADAKRWASKMLPDLRGHLRMAMDVQDSVHGKSGRRGEHRGDRMEHNSDH